MADQILSAERIAQLVSSYVLPGAAVPPDLFPQLARYLELLLKWNARTNLTAIRDPEEIVRRHFGESLFAAAQCAELEGGCPRTVLDFGSGAGFPGLPMQLFLPGLRVTLGESQNKKATFLREVVRTLNLPTEVWGERIEAMPEERFFDLVAMRAVDKMELAVLAAAERSSKRLMVLGTERQRVAAPEGFQLEKVVEMPGSNGQEIVVLRRS